MPPRFAPHRPSLRPRPQTLQRPRPLFRLLPVQRFGHRPLPKAKPYLCMVKTKPSTAPHPPAAMFSLLHNFADRYPEVIDLLFFIGRLGLFVYIAIGLYPILRKHSLNRSNSNTNTPRPLNVTTVYNTQQAAQYLHCAASRSHCPAVLSPPSLPRRERASPFGKHAPSHRPPPPLLRETPLPHRETPPPCPLPAWFTSSARIVSRPSPAPHPISPHAHRMRGSFSC